MGNGDGPGRAVTLGVRPGHDIPAGIDRAVRIEGVVMAFQRRQRRRLVMRHDLPKTVTQIDLQRRDDDQRQNRIFQRALKHRHVTHLQDLPGRDRGDEAQSEFDRCHFHMREDRTSHPG